MQTIDYKAIARRFRPQTFKDVTGQDAIVTTLKNAILQKKVSHAYLFSGIRGTGKTTLARLFAKALNCSSPSPECEPCNQCSSCQEITTARSLDVLEIDGASNRGIDDIRGLNETLSYATFQGRYKIFIIDEVHMLTKEAFNALLKTLEEPPSHVKFFFATTEPHKIPPTILSRCQKFDLLRITTGEIIKKLRSIASELGAEVENDGLSFIAKLAEGSLRDAESLFDQILCLGISPITKEAVASSLGLISKELFFTLDEAYQTHDVALAFDLAQTLFSSGKETSHLIDHLLEHYRNIALLFLRKLAPGNFSEEEKEGYTKALSTYTLSSVLYILDYLSQFLHQIAKLPVKKIHLEMLFLHIIQSSRRIGIDQIVHRLHTLQTAPPLLPPAETPCPPPPPPPAQAQCPAPLPPPPLPIRESASSAETAPTIETAPAIEAAPKPEQEPLSSIEPLPVELASVTLPEPSAQLPPMAPPPATPPLPPLTVSTKSISIPPSLRHETLLRFAAVELNASPK